MENTLKQQLLNGIFTAKELFGLIGPLASKFLQAHNDCDCFAGESVVEWLEA